MSTSSSRRIRRGGDGGFTLIEILVAFGLLTVVMLASLPALIAMLGSTVTTKMSTQAKNLAQERFEQLRDLRFHVDRQNGPFLDLLDLYYTHSSAATAPITVPTGGTGRYLATGSSNGVAAPVYEVATGDLPGATQYRQVVLSQFLGVDGAVLPASRYEGSYDSQVVGRDAPPTLLVRVTVVTSWTEAGRPKSYRATTVLSEGNPEQALIQTQARAAAVTLSSTAADATTLQLQAGIANLDGAQSSGSSASGYVTGALATRAGATTAVGQLGQFVLPDQAAASSGSGGAQSGGTGCSWYGFGPNAVQNVTADLTDGLPKAPANVEATSTPNVVTGAITQGTGNGCGLLSFDTTVDGGTARSADVVGSQMGAAPFARVPDGSGSGVGVSASAYMTASPLLAVPQQSRSGAAVAMGQPLVLFPNHPSSAGRGLVSARLSEASVACVSGPPNVSGTVVGRYVLELGWWGRGTSDAVARWHTRTWTYDSSAGAAPTAAGDVWEPEATVLTGGTTLAQLITATVPSDKEGVVATGATTGLRGFPSGIVTLTTASTLVNESAAGFSAVKAQLGQLTCVADDQR